MDALILADVVAENASVNVNVDTERDVFAYLDAVVAFAAAVAPAVAEVDALILADDVAENASVNANVDTERDAFAY